MMDASSESPPPSAQTLDLRTEKCPLNYVKASLALEKLAPGEILEVWTLPDSESARHIPASFRQAGRVVMAIQQTDPDRLRIYIEA